MRTIAFNCSVSRSSSTSSTDRMLGLVHQNFAREGVSSKVVYAVDQDIRPGGTLDEDPGNARSVLRRWIVKSEPPITGTLIWTDLAPNICN